MFEKIKQQRQERNLDYKRNELERALGIVASFPVDLTLEYSTADRLRKIADSLDGSGDTQNEE